MTHQSGVRLRRTAALPGSWSPEARETSVKLKVPAAEPRAKQNMTRALVQILVYKSPNIRPHRTAAQLGKCSSELRHATMNREAHSTNEHEVITWHTEGHLLKHQVLAEKYKFDCSIHEHITVINAMPKCSQKFSQK